MPQLTQAERLQVDLIMRRDPNPMHALRTVNKARRKHGIADAHKSSIYNYINGKTHRPRNKDPRGRKKILKRADVRKLQQARLRLIKQANSERRVTHADVQKEAGLQDVVCQRVCEDALRKVNVRFRAPRRKGYLSDEDAKTRQRCAEKWQRRPSRFWSESVHAYVDNKAFPMPLTPKQRQKYKQTRVTGHLRTPAEGVSRGFTKPRTQHTFLGVPSVNIAAAVAKDKVIMWHVVQGSWNGKAAAQMYKGPLAKALVKTWGRKRQYTIVEDGDRKGNQSGDGIRAKAETHIKALTLPPRTPCWMPLDYAIWSHIEAKMIETEPAGTEKKPEWTKRLEWCARHLPRGLVRKAIARMPGNIKALAKTRGYHSKRD